MYSASLILSNMSFNKYFPLWLNLSLPGVALLPVLYFLSPCRQWSQATKALKHVARSSREASHSCSAMQDSCSAMGDRTDKSAISNNQTKAGDDTAADDLAWVVLKQTAVPGPCDTCPSHESIPSRPDPSNPKSNNETSSRSSSTIRVRPLTTNLREERCMICTRHVS